MDSDAIAIDKVKGNFDVSASREQALFLERVRKVFEESNSSSVPQDEIDPEDDDENDTMEERKEEPLLLKYKQVRQKLWNTRDINLLCDMLSQSDADFCKLTDKYGRTPLHIACENGHRDMVNLLLCLGCNPNREEKCGLTPLSLCVINSHQETGKLLFEFGASCQRGKPSPQHVAEQSGENYFLHLFKTKLETDRNNLAEVLKQCAIDQTHSSDSNQDKTDTNSEFNVSQVHTLVFGDNGVEKLIRAVKNRSGKFEMFEESPGDLHAAGYANECMAKTLGPGGMFYCLSSVLKRKNNADTYGSQKFQDGNLASNAEGCRDIALGYGIAAFQEFKSSEYFPAEVDFIGTDKSSVYLKHFKQFLVSLHESEKCDYYLQALELYGPWLDLYKLCVRNASGIGREVVWLISLLIYGPLQKKNYYVCAFVHCINFCYKWPALLRSVVRKNFAVSVRGQPGHSLAMDEYVESRMVKPLKMYATGHTSIRVLQALSVSSQYIHHVREVYSETFSLSQSRSHKVPNSVPDQLRVGRFALKERFFRIDCQQQANVFDSSGRKSEYVPKRLCKIEAKGKDMLKKRFSSKMYTSFREWRKAQLS